MTTGDALSTNTPVNLGTRGQKQTNKTDHYKTNSGVQLLREGMKDRVVVGFYSKEKLQSAEALRTSDMFPSSVPV